MHADYVPCKTPLNMTMTLDDRPEIPLHPLDLTAEPPTDPTAQFCIGLIQSADPQLSRPDSSIGDMILGVPFMRNVYTVMAYTTPNTDGSFPLVASSDNQTDGGISQLIHPRLGLLSLTDPTTALKEFNTVRVLNQPISSSSPANNTGSNGNTKTIDVGGKHLSIGILVLIGLLSFFGLCCILFFIRWFIARRSYRHTSRNLPPGEDDDGLVMDKKSAYRLARRNSSGVIATGDLTEDQLREMRFQAFLQKEKRVLSDGTMDSDRTLAVEQAGGVPPKAKQNLEEFGVVVWKDSESGHGHPVEEEDDEVWDPRTAGLPWKDSTLVGTGQRQPHAAATTDLSPPSSPERAVFPHHRSTYSDPEPAHPHRQMPSVDIPLLSSQQYPPPDDEYRDNPTIPTRLHHAHKIPHNLDPHHDYARETDDLAEFGLMNGVGMAGVGSASRTTNVGAHRLDSPTFNRDSLMSMGGATLEGAPTTMSR